MDNTANPTRFHGKKAAPGRAIGRPIVVGSECDLDKVRAGDIMIAAQTDITFVPAMHRASAIVTETGGRFSHAAVWARENSKPTLLQVTGATRHFAGIKSILVNADEEYIEILEVS